MFQREVSAAEIRHMQNSEGRDNEESNCQAIHIIRMYHFIKYISIIFEHLFYTRPCAKSLTHSIFINTITLMGLLGTHIPFELMRKLKQWKVKIFAPSHGASNQPGRAVISEPLTPESLHSTATLRVLVAVSELPDPISLWSQGQWELLGRQVLARWWRMSNRATRQVAVVVGQYSAWGWRNF